MVKPKNPFPSLGKKVEKPQEKKSKKKGKKETEKKAVQDSKPVDPAAVALENEGTASDVKDDAKAHMSGPISSARKGRVKSGIHNFDDLIQGGFKEGSVTLLVASPGSGKTIFSFQFLKTGLDKGEACLYLTFEEKKEKLYDDMMSFKWDLAKFEAQKKFFVLEYNPEQVKSLIEEGGGTVDQLISKYNISRIVIDSITSFELLYQDDLARKQAGLRLFELINKWGCTAILTSQAQSRKFEPESDSLQFEADNILLLYHFKKHGERVRGIEILKMRGTQHTNRTMGLRIDNKGISVRPDEVITLDEASGFF